MRKMAKLLCQAVVFFITIQLTLVLFFSYVQGLSPLAYLEARELRKGFDSAAFARGAVEDFSNRYPRYPISNEEAGIPASSTFKAGSLERLQIIPGGVIALHYSETLLNTGGTIYLIPPQNGRVTAYMLWDCVSSDFSNIDKVIDICRYLDKPSLLKLMDL